ncbi:putative acyltransferase [Talaromyces proteolyticus]|uniref:Acyltransferase n=1 Tax=Talaromyces proteolyticus TaxID=1131652 RepID=A0AAD4Q489_9EURO|nr:putative acyltransferase [Talaromyces proteolyticus]KAH8702608.1 putative acyltransferase [Talaromyces proteolyticus]
MSDLRHRIPEVSTSSTQSGELRAKEQDGDPELKHGILMQILRSLLLITWFNGCCVVIVITQFIGAPLYFVNKDYFYAYMSMTKQCFGILIITVTHWGAPTLVRVSGDESVKGQLHLTPDGRLKTNFTNRLVFIANHQVYTDWLYLWWITYTSRMHGHIYIILKESLKYIPLLGTGMMFYGFIFMARKWESDKPRLQHRLDKLKTRHSGPMSGPQSLDPMWLLIFPEGTNLSINTKRISDKYGEKTGIEPLKHMILPRSTGLFFCLQQLKGTVDCVYDCTIGYEGPPKGCYPDRYFTLRSTYGQGRPPKSVNMYWRRWAVEDIPLDDQRVFEEWLLERWREKDALLDQFFETGRFPTSLESSIDSAGTSGNQAIEASRGYIETTIQLRHWIEIGEIFAVLLFCALGFLYWGSS